MEMINELIQDLTLKKQKSNLKGKVVVLRTDFDTPVHVDNGEITLKSTFKIDRHLPTIDFLLNAQSKIVILSHQGRPSQPDFVSLQHHSKYLKKIYQSKTEVFFHQDFDKKSVSEHIKNLKNSQILILENMSYINDEMEKNRTVMEHATKSMIVNLLRDSVDYFVHDAFSLAHENFASNVGFIPLKPSFIGLSFEKDLKILSQCRILFQEPSAYILGGKNVLDTVNLIERLLLNEKKINFLLGGVVSLVFLYANGIELSQMTQEYLEDYGHIRYVNDAKRILEKADDSVILPIDLAYFENNSRIEKTIKAKPLYGPIYDIGHESITMYKKKLSHVEHVFLHGTLGNIENQSFHQGTQEILNALNMVSGLRVVAGEKTVDFTNALGYKNHYMIPGGCSVLRFLSKQNLPVLQALATKIT